MMESRFVELKNGVACGNAQAAAILCLAEVISNLPHDFWRESIDSLGHEICMGVRHGLMGASAGGDANIGEYMPAIE